MNPSVLHLRLTNRMDSVFRVSSIVSLTAWLCVGVQQPAVCMRASGRQQECVSPVMNEAEDAEACGRAVSQGSPAPRGSPASGHIQTPTPGSRPAARVAWLSRGRRRPECYRRPMVPLASSEQSWMDRCGEQRAIFVCLILLEPLLFYHSLPQLTVAVFIYTTFPLTPLLEATPPPPLISDQPDHGDDKLTPACLPPSPSLFRRLSSQISRHAVLQTRSGVTFECPLCNP